MASSPALDVHFASGPGAGALQDLLYAELDDHSPLAIQELEHPGGWRVFFRTVRERDAAHLALESSLGSHVVDLFPVSVEDEDWASRTQADLKAIRIGRLIIAPPWDSCLATRNSQLASRDSQLAPRDPDLDRGASGEVRDTDPDTITIVINPSTGFGTGHHATTRMCLELLQDNAVGGRRVIDVGTGSGLLAIAAATLGAASVVAVDNDPEALHNARENVMRNGAADRIELLEADLGELSLTAGDIVLANLTGAMLQRYSKALIGLASPGGTAILSGFGPDESQAIAARWIGWSVHDRRHDGEWAAVALTERLSGQV